MKHLYILFLLFFFGIGTFAQNFTRDSGIRFGEGVFLSYRQFFDDTEAIETMAGFSKNGFRIIGLREYFQPVAIHRSDNLKLMYGYGIHAGVNYTNKYQILNRVYYHDWMWTPQFGVDGIFGLAYSANEFPILIQAAVHPYFEYSLNSYFNLKALNFVISFKYRY